MKEKILAALKTKHASVIKEKGLGEKALLGIAAMLAITTKEESEIETVVSSDGVVEALTSIQGEVDSRVTDAVKKAKAEKKPEGGDGNTKPKNEDPNDKGGDDDEKVPAWAKGLVEKLDNATKELEAFKAEKTAKTLNQRITDALKEKKVDEDYIKDQLDGRTFDSEEDADAFAEKVEKSWGALKQKFADQKLGEGAESPFVSNSDGESDFITNLKAAAATAVPKEN
ncbi:hypothetical protein [Parapedobacter soli]|uniref:hypothetical protein n=1 Tax=Parapedobacter soli TaxID=416955 RepID=UPI0021C69AFC|nr:hypothetical protein [Parapedobacter soli]